MPDRLDQIRGGQRVLRGSVRGSVRDVPRRAKCSSLTQRDIDGTRNPFVHDVELEDDIRTLRPYTVLYITGVVRKSAEGPTRSQFMYAKP